MNGACRRWTCPLSSRTLQRMLTILIALLACALILGVWTLRNRP